jgi:ubiquinone biosynthesis monooxygenase Coq6
MHVTDGLTGAALDFDAPSGSNAALGVMAEISNLQQALLRRLDELNADNAVNVLVRDGCKVQRIEAMAPGSHGPSASHVDSWPLLHFEDASVSPLKARLLVGADGHNSPVRKYAGISAHGWSYDRMGVVGTLKNRGLDHGRTAYQRFLPTGTLAWLPLSQEYASMVWTLPPDLAKCVIDLQKAVETQSSPLDDSSSPTTALITAAFRLPWLELEEIFHALKQSDLSAPSSVHTLHLMIEERLTRQALDPEQMQRTDCPPPVDSISNRSVAGFPLKLSHAESYLGSSLRRLTLSEAGAAAITPSNVLHGAINLFGQLTSQQEEARSDEHHGRTALIGDAAHTIHPLAGQGLNLGIADARSLSDAIIEATREGGDIGSHVSLQAYPRQRYLANQAVLSAVDHLHWLFATTPPGQASNSLLGDLVSRGVVWARSTGFEVLNELDVIKRAIIGAAGSVPPSKKV